MSTIGSGIAGSVAGAPLSGQTRVQQQQAEQTEQAAKARELRKLADIQRHEVENTEQAKLESVLPDERRRRRRRRRPDGTEEDIDEVIDQLELRSAPAAAQAAKPPAVAPPPGPAPPKPAKGDSPQSGGLLDVEA